MLYDGDIVLLDEFGGRCTAVGVCCNHNVDTIKIKVGAPALGELKWFKSAIDILKYGNENSASVIISKKFFDKKGKPKKKKIKDIEKIEARFNALLNALVAIPTASDDW